MIIGISGYAGSGKDTVGNLILYNTIYESAKEEIYSKISPDFFCKKPFDDLTDWQIKKFADKLKDVASLLTGIEKTYFEDQEFKKTNLPTCWWTTNDEGYQPMTVREFLQKLGTDALRDNLHTNVWVNALFTEYVPVQASEIDEQGKYVSLWDSVDDISELLPNWVVTDVRFPNEAQAIKDKGGIIIRVNRPGCVPINAHPSETSLNDWKFDYIIENNQGIDLLMEHVKDILKQENIIQ